MTLRYRIKRHSTGEQYYYLDGKNWHVKRFFQDLPVSLDRFSTWEEARDWTVKQIDMNRISS